MTGWFNGVATIGGGWRGVWGAGQGAPNEGKKVFSETELDGCRLVIFFFTFRNNMIQLVQYFEQEGQRRIYHGGCR